MLRLERVGLSYGRGAEVLKDVDFELQRGSFCFLTGASGAGKSSLLKLAFMALHPSRGRIKLFDQDITRVSRRQLPFLRRRIGVVFQDFRLLDHLTTFENVALPLRVAGKLPRNYERDVRDLLDWVGLAKQADSYPPVLSGGEQQRAAIARAVISKPELLLADEPTGNVDPILARRLIRLFAELNKLGTTVLLATHDMNLLKHVRAPVLHLENGALQQRH
ncbi:MAG: cell division ATP-binding protein FtsE [Proteobacteria bacterium]|nr:cell division ATP-binding protein FtsE [Pseudomonadota bacterium]